MRKADNGFWPLPFEMRARRWQGSSRAPILAKPRRRRRFTTSAARFALFTIKRDTAL